VIDPPKWCQLSISLGCSASGKSLRPLQPLLPNMSLIGILHSVSEALKSIQSCGVSASNLSQPHIKWSIVSSHSKQAHMGISSMLIRPRWLLRHEWFAITLCIMEITPRSPFKQRPLWQPSESLTLDKGRKSEGQTGANHSIPFSTASPANWSAVHCQLASHVMGSTSCEFDTHCSPASNRPH
jgi:hypothetical protein